MSNDEATDCARMLALREGVFAGFSSGANLAAAIQVLQRAERGSTVAFLACDTGLKYLSTGLYP